MKILWTLVGVLATTATASADDQRPSRSIGIGAGYIFPADLQQVAAAATRFRLDGGLTLEPAVEIGYNQIKTEVPGSDVTNSETTLALASSVRYPVISRGPLDLVVGGTFGVGFALNDPEGSDNNTTSISAAARWLFSIEYWISEHWNVSFNADNPLVSWSRVSTEVSGSDDNIDSTLDVGLIYAPRIGLFGHLFF